MCITYFKINKYFAPSAKVTIKIVMMQRAFFIYDYQEFNLICASSLYITSSVTALGLAII